MSQSVWLRDYVACKQQTSRLQGWHWQIQCLVRTWVIVCMWLQFCCADHMAGEDKGSLRALLWGSNPNLRGLHPRDLISPSSTIPILFLGELGSQCKILGECTNYGVNGGKLGGMLVLIRHTLERKKKWSVRPSTHCLSPLIISVNYTSQSGSCFLDVCWLRL